MAKKLDRSRSTQLTGGAGFSFEDMVVTCYLVALLREEAALGGHGKVVRVAVQQAAKGEPMDDVVVDTAIEGKLGRLGLQVKSSLALTNNDSDFIEVVRTSISTRAKEDFRVGWDRYGFIVQSVAAARLDSLCRIIERARASTNAEEFASRFAKGGESSQRDVKLRNDLRNLVCSESNSDDDWDFYRHFFAFRLDGLGPGGDRLAELGNRLSSIGKIGGPELVEILARIVRQGQGVAQIWTRETLIQMLQSKGVRLNSVPSYAHDLGALKEYTKNALADIRNDIGGFTLQRGELVSAVEEMVQSHRLSTIIGLPGCGKSVILRRCVERASAEGPVLFLKSDRLEGASWQSFARGLGLGHGSPRDILVEIGSSGTAIVFIDGIDRVQPKHRGIVTDIINTIVQEPAFDHWRVLVTCRDHGLEVFRSWIPLSLYAKTGLGSLSVDQLSDDEAELLSEKVPPLRSLLFESSNVQEVARRPFFAAVLAGQLNSFSLDPGLPPQTESELIAVWWKAGGYDRAALGADGRQRALLDLARVGAARLGKYIEGRNLRAETINHLESLRYDKLVDVVELGSVYKFTHDIFFEWSFLRLLIDEGRDWPRALVSAGEPPLLARIVSLFSQHTFERNGSGWMDGYALLGRYELRPQWRRAWILGAPESNRFVASAEDFERPLAMEDYRLLIKFLVWFQAERTIPNPLILENPQPGLESATLIRGADLFGWPSDILLWQRVLSWLSLRVDSLPVKVIPYVVDVFRVWQNLFADNRNAYSKRIIKLAENWLIELSNVEMTRWRSLKTDTMVSLEDSLRRVLFRAARAYPASANRLLEKLIAIRKRTSLLSKCVYDFSAVLSQTCPDTLARFVTADSEEELPRQRMIRAIERQKQRAATLAAVRNKPQESLTQAERQFLSSSHMPFSIEAYDFEDLGIRKYHGSFHPPAPAREPFISLLRFAPEVALQLIRDLANRATTGWQQIHEINHPQYGTPIAIQVDFPWGTQSFWGDDCCYSWYFGEGGPQPLMSAFLSLLAWAHECLDQGEDLDELIQRIVQGHKGVAALGLAVSLALERAERTPTVFAMMRSQRLWVLDFRRQIQEGTRELDFFGLDFRAQMNNEQRAADLYLKQRRYRFFSLKDLASIYMLEGGRESQDFSAVVSRFPLELPYEVEEQRGDEATEARMRANAEGWAQFGNTENYVLEPIPGRRNSVKVNYLVPSPQSRAAEERRVQAARKLTEHSIADWAVTSISERRLDLRFCLEDAIKFVQEVDRPGLLLRTAEIGEGRQQTCIAAVAAATILLGEDMAQLEWAWSVIDRVVEMAEDEDELYYNRPLDPRHFSVIVLAEDAANRHGRDDSAERLLTKAADPNPRISKGAFAAIFGQPDLPTALTWNAAVLASELFIGSRRSTHEKRCSTHNPNELRSQALGRAIARVNLAPSEGATKLVPPPPAWVVGDTSSRAESDVAWNRPDPDFLTNVAQEVVKFFPVEKWAIVEELRNRVLEYTAELVRWTTERISPPFADGGEEGARLSDWLTELGTFTSRVATMTSSTDAWARFIKPIAEQRGPHIVNFLASLTDGITCRHVYDAPEIQPGTLKLLDKLLTRILMEPGFSPTSHRHGDLQRPPLKSMLKAFLMVSVDDAPGAVRFANGAWHQLPLVLPLVKRMVEAGAWSPFVIQEFLVLAERAGSALPVEFFSSALISSMDSETFRLGQWREADIPARVAGVVQMYASCHHPLTSQRAYNLLLVLDRLVDFGDRRAAALQQSELFRNIQVPVESDEG